MVNFKIDRLPSIHIVDRYLDTVKLFDVKNDDEGLDYFLSEEDKKTTPDLKSLISGRFIVLSIGGKHNTKKAPPFKLAKICNRLVLPVLILGDMADKEGASKIISLCSKKDITDLTGKLGLNQSAYVIMKSQLVITHDTGLMHIAAAFKKKIVSIWGNTIPEFGMSPYLPAEGSRIFEVKELGCRPCSKIGFKKCPEKHFDCMIRLDENIIAEYVNDHA